MSLKSEGMPRHVAIIMDGNRRWAKKRGLPVVAGHRAALENRVEELIERAGELGIPYLTFWAFSTENWGRAEEEVKGLMRLFRLALKRFAKRFVEKGARLNVIGDLRAFPEDIQEGLRRVMKESRDNSKITVTFALNYGGRDELLRAFSKLSKAISNDQFLISNLNEESFEGFLDTVGMPDPDLIIRTSGEQRLSGLMPWQSVYAELYFPGTLMPDFDAKEFDAAIEEYQRRSRRFGKG